MSIFLEVDGVVYENFTGATVTTRLDTLSNTFSFGAIAENGNLLPFQKGQSCKVRIDNDLVLTGTIEVINVDYDSRSHNISIQGRDRTGDLLDSTIGTLSDVTPPISLKAIIEKVIANIETDLTVSQTFDPGDFERTVSVLSGEKSQNAFKFIENLARQKQVLLTSDAAGNVVITRSEATAFTAGILQNVLNADDNNILSASFSDDDTGRYNRYVFASQLNPLAINNSGSTSVSDIVLQEGAAVDPDIRKGRQLILVAENPFSTANNDDRALWEANIRKARGRLYSVKVQDHRINGALWQINTLVNITDVWAGISGQMLLNAITYTFDVDNGSVTELQFVDKNAYSLTLAEPKTDTIGLI